MGTPQMLLSTVKEEWRCVSTEHMEQSAMWAGTSWMPKWLVVNLAIMVSTDVYLFQCSLKYVILFFGFFRSTSAEWFQSCSMVWLCLSGECDVQWYREIRD